MFNPRNGSLPQKKHRDAGTDANVSLVAGEIHVVSSSATQPQPVAQTIRELYAVLLQLNHRFPDSRQQLTILSTPRRILINPTHDSRRHGLTGIIREIVDLGDTINIKWLVCPRSNNLDDKGMELVFGDNILMTCRLSKEPGDRNADAG